MARSESNHVAYRTNEGGMTTSTDQIALFGSKLAALERAVDEGWKYAPWPAGMTLREAIKAHEASKAPKVARPVSTETQQAQR